MQVLNNILPTDICTINEKNEIIIIMSSNSTFPEDYVEADYSCLLYTSDAADDN